MGKRSHSSAKSGRSRKRVRQWEEKQAAAGQRRDARGWSDGQLGGAENRSLHSSNVHKYMYDEVDEYTKSKLEHVSRDTLQSASIKIDDESDDNDFGEDVSRNEEEILPINADDVSGDEEISVDFDSSVDGVDDDVDIHAWGKKRTAYYTHAGDDVGEGGWSGSDAELEEEEALLTQEKHASNLTEMDFGLSTLLGQMTEVETEETEKSVVARANVDSVTEALDKLSQSELLDLVKKQAPELPGLCDEFRQKMDDCETKWFPLYKGLVMGKQPGDTFTEYVSTKLHVSLWYCLNISFYLLLRSRTGIQGLESEGICEHPVIQRLVTYKQMMTDLDDKVNLHTIEPDIEKLVKKLTVTSNVGVVNEMQHPQMQPKASLKTNKREKVELKEKKKKSGIFEKKFDNAKTDVNDSAQAQLDLERALCRMEANEDNNEDVGLNPTANDVAKSSEDPNRRPISYEIEKNKVVVRQKRAEQRNPRVKHRVKYRRANIRRKGQVRPHRYEMSRYSGELSGINRQVVKSVKLA